MIYIFKFNLDNTENTFFFGLPRHVPPSAAEARLSALIAKGPGPGPLTPLAVAELQTYARPSSRASSGRELGWTVISDFLFLAMSGRLSMISPPIIICIEVFRCQCSSSCLSVVTLSHPGRLDLGQPQTVNMLVTILR